MSGLLEDEFIKGYCRRNYPLTKGLFNYGMAFKTKLGQLACQADSIQNRRATNPIYLINYSIL